jgi:hypothetical protein
MFMAKKKSYVWVYILAIVILVSLVYAYNPSVNESVNNFFEGIEVTSENSKTASQGDESCPDGIIPEIFVVSSDPEQAKVRVDSSVYPVQANVWMDGAEMKTSPTSFVKSCYDCEATTPFYNGLEKIKCHQGSGEGENISHLYCSPADYHRTDKNIDSDGNILNVEGVYYQISLILLNKKIEEIPLYNGVGDTQIGTGYSYEVIDAKCKKIVFD